MNSRKVLTFFAALMATAGQALLFAADTASVPEAAPTVATAARLVSGLLGV